MMARCKNHTNQRRCFTISFLLSVSLSSVGTAACARTMPSAICHCPSPYRSQCQSQCLLHPLRNGHTQSVTVTVHIKPMIVVIVYCVISWLCKKKRKKKRGGGEVIIICLFPFVCATTTTTAKSKIYCTHIDLLRCRARCYCAAAAAAAACALFCHEVDADANANADAQCPPNACPSR